VYLACVGAVVHRMQHPHDPIGKVFNPLLGGGGGSGGGIRGTVLRYAPAWLGRLLVPGDDSDGSDCDGAGGAGSSSSSSSSSSSPRHLRRGHGARRGGRSGGGGPWFADVAGVEGPKRELAELVDFMAHPARWKTRKRFHIRAPNVPPLPICGRLFLWSRPVSAIPIPDPAPEPNPRTLDSPPYPLEIPLKPP